MSTTPNYGLYLTDDSSEKFLDWRNKINGTTNSNMTKIDEVLGDKADASVTLHRTLLASAWSANGTQSFIIEGLTVAQNGMAFIGSTATAAQYAAAEEAVLSIVTQTDNTLTLSAVNVPAVDIPVTIMLFG